MTIRTDPNGPIRYAASGVDVTADLIKLYDQKYPLPAAAAAPKPPVAGGAAVQAPITNRNQSIGSIGGVDVGTLASFSVLGRFSLTF